MVIFPRDRMPGAEDNPGSSCRRGCCGGRDGGHWLRPGAGAGDGGSGPRQCAAALEVAGQAARHQRRDSLRPQPPMPGASSVRLPLWVIVRAVLGIWPGLSGWRAGGVPLKLRGKGVTDRRLRSAGLRERSLRMPLGTSRSTYYARRRSGSPQLPPPHFRRLGERSLRDE